MIESTVCDWRSGNDLITTNPFLFQTLKRIEKLDWYTAFSIKREIREMNWCFTGRLLKVDTQDKDSILYPTIENGVQAAIRILNQKMAYIDSSVFAAMDIRF